MGIEGLIAFTLADVGHMDWDVSGGWWIVMVLGMAIFWGLIILGIVWLVRELGGSHRHMGASSDALSVLDHRLAEGAITPDEYRQRRAILTGEGESDRDKG